jgi:MFS family permease
MYVRIRENLPEQASDPGRARTARRVSANVLALGITSLITDISSEMVVAVLPLYFVLSLQLSPLSFGVIDGLYHGVAALVRIASGVIADRWGRYKEVAAAGYGLSAVAKLGLLAAGSAWTAMVGVILVDRSGKGLRTSPRDALISLSTAADNLGHAFGVHRALDTAGALAGPLVAFAILWTAPGAFDAVFVVSFFIALIGLSVLLLFVRNHRVVRPGDDPRPSFRSAARLLADRPFRAVVVVGALLSLVTLSDGFLYLVLQRQLDLSVGFFPLLYVATATVYLALAVPLGRLADRVGRSRVFVAGYVLLAGAYLVLLNPGTGAVGVVLAVLMFGAFYAATDGVLMAMASAVLPESLRTSGLSVLTTFTSLGRLFASILFGALWTVFGQSSALVVVFFGLAGALALAVSILFRRQEVVVDA